ncbi:MAG TPA: HAMP domain-containing sensor histidine kinase [Ramlibacter sp.]|nr:HAMP domain-containing sensor histidine kinase [Ramlibacter sp.]
MNKPAGTKQVAAAAGALAVLEGQAETVRAELSRLRQELAQVEHDFSARRGAELLEANEQLVLAAMRAQEIADRARSNLDALVTSGTNAVLAPIPPRSGPAVAESGRDEQDLLEANEHLVLAALTSKEREATAQAAYRRQIAFLATVAHELRNPLMPLRLATHMLSRARADEAEHTKLQATITGQVGQITRLINDLLDGSRISTGKLRLERTVIDLGDIVQLAIETHRPAMDARNHRFSTVMPAGPVKVLGDPARLAQVFGNLLGNACKYTPEGGKISLQTAVTTDTVSITVSDNGIGISASALPHVFDLFVQDGRATLISPGGLGIGLAVVRELVNAHEGSVVAHSAGHDRGSQFVVTLPLAVGKALAGGSPP